MIALEVENYAIDFELGFRMVVQEAETYKPGRGRGSHMAGLAVVRRVNFGLARQYKHQDVETVHDRCMQLQQVRCRLLHQVEEESSHGVCELRVLEEPRDCRPMECVPSSLV